MMNFHYFTHYKLLYKEPTNDTPYMPPVEKIIPYGKLFIVNEIMNANATSLMEIKKNNSLQNNWLHNFLWQLIILAKSAQKIEGDIPQYIKDNLSIITFNYDYTIDEILPTYLITQDNTILAEKIISHVYGVAWLEEKDKRVILKTMENGLLKFFFNKIDKYKYNGDKITLTKDAILQQLNEHINWIAETDDKAVEQQEKYREQIKSSKNIYFLGFGFDINNMKRLGLLTAENKFDIDLFKGKTIYISKGNPKIRDFFRTNFKITEAWYKDNELYIATSPNNTKFIISDNYVNKAFQEDFTLF